LITLEDKLIFPNSSDIERVLFSEIKRGDLILVRQEGIVPKIDSVHSNSSLVPAFILSGAKGHAGKYTFESKDGSGVLLFKENNSCELYYDAIVLSTKCKVLLKFFDIDSLQKR